MPRAIEGIKDEEKKSVKQVKRAQFGQKDHSIEDGLSLEKAVSLVKSGTDQERHIRDL